MLRYFYKTSMKGTTMSDEDEFDETNMDGEIEEMGLGSETDGPVDLPLPGAGA